MKEYKIHYELIADPDAEGFVNVYTVNDAKKVKVKHIDVYFPSGTDGDLQISFYYGHMKIAPHGGLINGDNCKVTVPIDLELISGDTLRVYFKNRNTTDKKKAYIDIIVEEIS